MQIEETDSVKRAELSTITKTDQKESEMKISAKKDARGLLQRGFPKGRSVYYNTPEKT